MKAIAESELFDDGLGVLAAVAAGETFVIIRNGEPVAELRPVRRARRTFVARSELIRDLCRTPGNDSTQLREDLKRDIDQRL